MNVIGDFDVNDINIIEKLNILKLFKNDNLKRKLWKLSDGEYDYFIENEYNIQIQKSKNNNTIYGVKLLEDEKLWFYTMGM